MTDIIEIAMRSFWHFLGVYAIIHIVLFFVCNTLIRFWDSLMETIQVYKRGYDNEDNR